MNSSIQIGKLKLKNSVLAASGTFGYAEEFKDLVDLNKIGAIITKTITLRPRAGNIPPRIYETPSGMLNAIGLQNEGLHAFIVKKLPIFEKIKTPLIVSISPEGPRDIKKLVKTLDKIKLAQAIELNLSCPNIGHQQGLIAQDPKATYRLVKIARGLTNKTLITKLSPNVTDISLIAKSAEKAGADAVSLVNTFLALAVNVDKRKSVLGNVTGGLSGPAIKPIALRMVWEVYNRVKIPIIGMGGIMTARDALEFIVCGASAVCTGTANFVNPAASVEVAAGIEKYLKEKRLSLRQLTGSLNK